MGRMPKWILVAVLCVLLSITYLPMLGKSEVEDPRYGGTLVVIHWEDPKSMNPDAQVDDAGAAIFRNIYDQLFELTRNYDLVPGLAYAYDVSEDGRTYTFHLYQNVTWHDGVKFTSKDVKFTFEAIKKFHGIAYGHIKADNIESIECPDDYTVVFHLKEPYAPFVQLLSWYGTWIMPAHIWEGVEDWLDPSIESLTKPVGTGPFKLVEWVRGEHITLEANLNYHLGRPYLSRVVFKIIPDASVALQSFLAGEGDILGTTPELSQIPLINATKDTRVIMYPTASRWYIGFNLQRPLFQDVRVRKAIAYAINRSEINEKACSGFRIPAKYHYTPAVEWAVNKNATLPEYDPQMAEQLLDEAGYPRGPDGWRFTITYSCWTGPEEESIGEIIKDQLSRVGIKVVLDVSEFNIWEEKVVKNRDFDIALCDGFQGPDPANFILRVGSGQYINFAGYSNPEVDELFDLGGKEADIEKRKQYYYRIQEIVAEDLPYLWLFEVTGFGIWHTYFHDFWFEPSQVKRVSIGEYRTVWWEEGFSPKLLDDAAAAISKAEAENRTVGLDEAKTAYQQALNAFNNGDYEQAQTSCEQAINLANQATALGEEKPPPEGPGYDVATIVALVIVIVVIIAVIVAYSRRRKT